MGANRRILTAGVALMLTLAACTDSSSDETGPATTADAGNTTTDGSTDDDGATTTSPASGTGGAAIAPELSADDFGLELEPTAGLAAPVPAPILSVAADPEVDDRLIVTFEMESHHCHGVEPTVAESDREVIVQVLTAPRPDANAGACDYGIFPYTVAVDLASPVGERTVTPAEPTEPADLPSIDDAASDDATDPSESELIDASIALVGRHVEDGVEWAIERNVDWRIISYDGVSYDDNSGTDVRLGFVVERDLITAVDWS